MVHYHICISICICICMYIYIYIICTGLHRTLMNILNQHIPWRCQKQSKSETSNRALNLRYTKHPKKINGVENILINYFFLLY